MDFNVKKLASDAGIFFTRAVQVRARHKDVGMEGVMMIRSGFWDLHPHPSLLQ